MFKLFIDTCMQNRIKGSIYAENCVEKYLILLDLMLCVCMYKM